MFGKDDLDAHLSYALHDSVKIFYLEPQQDAVSVGLVVLVAYGAMMMFDFEAVQLKNELSVGGELLIVGTSMTASAAEQTLIPPAAGFDISDGDEGLRTHGNRLVRKGRRCNPAFGRTPGLWSKPTSQKQGPSTGPE